MRKALALAVAAAVVLIAALPASAAKGNSSISLVMPTSLTATSTSSGPRFGDEVTFAVATTRDRVSLGRHEVLPEREARVRAVGRLLRQLRLRDDVHAGPDAALERRCRKLHRNTRKLRQERPRVGAGIDEL